MRFSFITCTYNRAKYLPTTLASLCEQTFDFLDYEVVIVDNNSTDNTAEICQNFISNFKTRQIRYFKEVNQGLSFALNRGVRGAQGEFLIYVDDDETIGQKHLELLEKHLQDFPDAVLAASPVVPIYEKEEPNWMSPFTQRLIGGYFNEGKLVKKLNKKSYPGTGHTIIKRELYDKYGFYNTELGRSGSSLIGAEDKDMFYRLIAGHVECYYFPDIPIYHHIPEYKLTDMFFDKLTYSIGKSERIRTKSVSEKEYKKRLFNELVKWMASILLCLFYVLTFRPEKGWRLLRFRKNVSKGLCGK